MTNHDYLGWSGCCQAQNYPCQQWHLMQNQAAMQSTAYGNSAYFNVMSMNANAKHTKSPHEIAAEIRARNPSMQVKRIESSI